MGITPLQQDGYHTIGWEQEQDGYHTIAGRVSRHESSPPQGPMNPIRDHLCVF